MSMQIQRSIHLAVIALGILLDGGSAGAGCVDYGNFLSWEYDLTLPAYPTDLEIQGGYAYAACGDSGLVVIDLATPAEPSVVRTVSTPYVVRGFEVSGSFAYVVDGFQFDAGSLSVIDIGTPETAYVQGSLELSVVPRAVGVVDNLVYIAGFDTSDHHVYRLIRVDASTPESPVVDGSWSLPDWPTGMAIVDGQAYVSYLGHNVHLIDLSNPTQQTPIGILSWINLSSVEVVGDLLYGSKGAGWGFFIFNVSDLENPTFVGVSDELMDATDIAVAGSYAYISDSDEGMRVYDVSDPTLPVLMGGVGCAESARALALIGDHAYVAYDRQYHDAGSLQVIDIGQVASPEMIGRLDSIHGLCVDIADGPATFAFVGENDSLKVVNYGDPSAPVVVAGVELLYYSTELKVQGDYAYVAVEEAGLQIFDVDDPLDPTAVGSIATPDKAWGLDVVGNTAYIAALDSGLVIVDVTDPTAPSRLGEVSFASEARGVKIEESYAFVAALFAGLYVVNVADPDAPFIVANLPLPDAATDLEVRSGLAFVTTFEAGLQIIDVSDPSNPYIRGSADTPGYSYDIALGNGIAYVADGQAGVQVIDIHDPSAPVNIGAIDTPEWAHDLVLAGSCIIVADRPGLVFVPHQCGDATPALLSFFELVESAESVTVAWSLADWGEHIGLRLMASNESRQWVVPHVDEGGGRYRAEDHRAPMGPFETITYRLYLTSGDGDEMLLAEKAVSLTRDVPPARLVGAFPNPFNPTTTIHFTSSQPGQVQLAVFDLSGRRVAILVDEALQAGAHERTWGGLGSDGSPVAAGVYFCRLEVEGYSEVRKLSLIK